MSENTFIQEYLDYCKIMKITPNSRDQMLFMGGWNCALIEQVEKIEPEYCEYTIIEESDYEPEFNTECGHSLIVTRYRKGTKCSMCGKVIRMKS